jgi:hypothetical protein
VNRFLMRSRAAAARRSLAVAVMLTFTLACADKGLVRPEVRGATSFALQVIAPPVDQVAGFGPKVLFIAAAYPVDNNGQSGNDEDSLFAWKFVPLQNGQQTVTLPVDIAGCIADPRRDGPEGVCNFAIGALITDDSTDILAGNDEFEQGTWDYAYLQGFEAAPGHLPNIPPIDLRINRFGVIRWEGDEGLRVGGDAAPHSLQRNPAGSLQTGIGPRISGAVGSDGSVSLYAMTQRQIDPPQPGSATFPHLAIFRNGSWTTVPATTAAPNSVFNDVHAVSTTEVYLGHPTGLSRYDGTNISSFMPTVTDPIFAVSVRTTAGGAKLMIAGTTDAVWLGTTTSMQRYTLPPGRIDEVCVTSTSEAFAASSVNGVIHRWNGTSWVGAAAPSTAPKLDLICPSPGVAYVTANSVAIYRWTGTDWSPMSGGGMPGLQRLIRIGVFSPTEIYASGDSASIDRAFYHYNGTTWTETGRKRFSQDRGRLWIDPRGGAAYSISMFARVERMTPNSVTVVGYQPALRDVSVTSPTSAFVVGWNMLLGRWDGTKWNVDTPPPGIQTIRILQGVWSSGPTNAWAVGNGSTILRYNGSAWSTVSHNLQPVISPSDNYNGVWGVGNEVWIVGDASIARCSSGGAGGTACANQTTGGGALYGIWGAAANDIFAVGSGGRILRYNGTTWTPMTSPVTTTLVRVSGSGPNDVWAVGDTTLLHFNGTAWSKVPFTSDPELSNMGSRAPSGLPNVIHLGLWVRNANEVYLGSDFGGIARFVASKNDWGNMRGAGEFPHRIMAISGADNCALAVAESQSPASAPILIRGVGSAGCFATPFPTQTNWP